MARLEVRDHSQVCEIDLLKEAISAPPNWLIGSAGPPT
jgi:hypothetical protein